MKVLVQMNTKSRTRFLRDREICKKKKSLSGDIPNTNVKKCRLRLPTQNMPACGLGSTSRLVVGRLFRVGESERLSSSPHISAPLKFIQCLFFLSNQILTTPTSERAMEASRSTDDHLVICSALKREFLLLLKLPLK
jgi:hypothetical protein